MTVAIKSGTKSPVVRVGGLLSAHAAGIEKFRESYGRRNNVRWSDEYLKFFWLRNLIYVVLLALPVSLIAITLWTLLGYLWIPLAIGTTVYAKNRTSFKWTDRQAYSWFRQLKDGWADHGKVFYNQIWNHTCEGKEHSRYEHCGYGGKCYLEHTTCTYCDKRLQEIRSLLESQQSIENTNSSEIDNLLFEQSAEFRKQIVKAGEQYQSAAMKEISGMVHPKDN